VDDAELDLLLRNERYPRSAGYSARWMVDGAMGPNPVWQAEALTDLMQLEPGMRILDMGCGTALPFAEDFFDALISIGAYHYYFGTDDLYLGYYSRFVKRGGQIGIVQPGLAEEPETLPPPHLERYWKWDFCAWHSPAWWRRHWDKTGLVTVEVADRLPDGWRDWLQWNEACDHDSGTPGREEAQMLRADAGRTLGLSRVIARRNSQALPGA
jgi:hypothetical protein